MQLIGITAGFDAGLALISWLFVRSRRRTYAGPPSKVVAYFQAYLVWTALFLVLTAIAMLWLTGTQQGWVVLLSDVALWIALMYFILLASINRSTKGRSLAVTVFWVLAIASGIYQVAQLTGNPLTFGSTLTYILTNMAPLLMYLVWVPSALLFLGSAAKTSDQRARMRFILLAIGLLLTTASWAWRLLGANPPITMILVISILGFLGILAGVLYQGQATAKRFA